MKKRSFSVLLAGIFILAAAFPFPASHAAIGRKEAPAAEEPIENAWPPLTDQQQAQAVAELKDFAEKTGKKLDIPLRMFETKYFLFYSDLPMQQAQTWAGLLDRMYARLAETFGVPKGKNIWRGKALVFVFVKKDDYRRYEREMVATDPGTSAGMCHNYGNGIVKIAFYRQPRDLEFAHVLVHESVHGFIHRYRTPVFVPSWANEGLAETIATDLVPQRGRRDMVKTMAREGLQQHGDKMGDFFTIDHIDAWQYPVAEELCTFMIQASKKNYVDFIKGIKAGDAWDKALAEDFKAPEDRLIPVFGRYLGIRNLEP